jgi:hypothetical protein
VNTQDGGASITERWLSNDFNVFIGRRTGYNICSCQPHSETVSFVVAKSLVLSNFFVAFGDVWLSLTWHKRIRQYQDKCVVAPRFKLRVICLSCMGVIAHRQGYDRAIAKALPVIVFRYFT